MKTNNEKMRRILKERMDEELFIHSLGVEEAAYNLAALYGIDSQKASLAGLLHDYAKGLPAKQLCRIASEYNLADDISRQEPALLHAPVGAWLLKHELGIDDQEVLEAIRVHTTGFPGMSPLSKIVYLADCLEPGRNYPGVKELRAIARRDLNQALLIAVDRTIKHIIDRGKIIHPVSILFRNSLILSKKNNQEIYNHEVWNKKTKSSS